MKYNKSAVWLILFICVSFSVYFYSYYSELKYEQHHHVLYEAHSDQHTDSAIDSTARSKTFSALSSSSSSISFTSSSMRIESNKCNYSQQGPRVLCAIFTHAKNFRSKARGVAETWAKRCHLPLFIVGQDKQQQQQRQLTTNISGISIVELNVSDAYADLSYRTIRALVYAHERHLNDFDWFLKADDDTFVMVDNMNGFLSDKCSNDMHTYGRHFKKFLPGGYLSGGSGYLISNRAIQLFGEAMRRDKYFCVKDKGDEDVDIARCLANLNVTPGESRDEQMRERFHPEPLDKVWHEKLAWLVDYGKHEPRVVIKIIIYI